ncbi:sensor histidine kinase [Fervidobacterium gondwanense]|uniref:HAMP domain-containing sensor histidine kinase n=1 Tax=Fervidobacterium gondwanense TaxID=44754 RepID=UPI003C7429ED
MRNLKLTTKISFFTTLASVLVVSIALLLIYRYFYVLAVRSVTSDFINPQRFVTVVDTPVGKQYFVLRWDVYVADLSTGEVINDPYGIGLKDVNGFQKIGDKHYYFVKLDDIILGKDVTPTMRFLENIRKIFMFTIVLIAGGIFLSTYVLTKESVKEIKAFVSEIELLGGSDVSYRVKIKPKSLEVEELVSKFNDLMERIERSYKAQESFVSAVSHELRTPIATLLGYVNMLKRWGAKNEEILTESVQAIEDSAKEIKNIIENMLLIARVETLTEEKINIRDFISEIVQHKFKDREVIVEGEGTIETNKEGLGIILTILVDNAFTHGAPPVIVSIDNGKIDVINHGPKISDEVRDKIFERFYKGENSSGTGLGLYIASEIAKKLGLQIKLYSSDERTVFSILKIKNG